MVFWFSLEKKNVVKTRIVRKGMGKLSQYMLQRGMLTKELIMTTGQ